MADVAATTVVIPSSGRRLALLERALQSVRSQTLPPRAIIVVVDGDARACADVAAIVGPGVQLVQTGTPRGASAARNLGVTAAATELVSFLDDDDRWKPDYLATVFAGGPAFDVALVAFEKHAGAAVRLEKVPPETLSPGAFLVGNPGIRGSNLTIRRSVHHAIGGFDEGLPSFNDMDFGLRLALHAVPLRYRRITAHLVEYHAHDGERLSGPRSPHIGPGARAFLARHGARMTPTEEAAFRHRTQRLWREDPWTLDDLRARLAGGDGADHAASVGHAAQTRHHEVAGDDDDVADACWSLAREAARRASPQLRALRLVVITTDVPGSFAAWLRSLAAALDDAGWRPDLPAVEVLRIANDVDPVIDAHHRAATCSGVVVHHIAVPSGQRPLPLASARPFAVTAARARGWDPSAAAPVWWLDEDFRFESLAPARGRGFVRRSGGPLLHRLDAVAADLAAAGVDALVGGNTGAAPVPALGTLLRQLTDLCAPAPAQHETLRLRMASDAYYDLAEADDDLRAPVRGAWWRTDGELVATEVAARLRAGLPVTRAAMAMPPPEGAGVWADRGPATVAGGNVVFLSPRAFTAAAFAHGRSDGLISRRADTLWCLRAAARGARIVRCCLPLLHDRALGDPGPEAAAATARADALGVGLYRAWSSELDVARALDLANQRLARQRHALERAAAVARSATAPALVALADWIDAARIALHPLRGPIEIVEGC